MKYSKWFMGCLGLCMASFSCNKTITPPGTSFLTMINAVVGSQPLVSNFNADQTLYWFKTASQLSYGAFNATGQGQFFNQFSSYSGDLHLAVYQYPDSADALFDLHINLPVGSAHSLYFTGTTENPDTVFIKDELPYYGTDSLTGIRFVNLSPGSAPVSINLQGQAAGSEVKSLPYKGVTTFKSYSATSAIVNYVFEIRDAASGTLISTYTALNVGIPGQYAGNTWQFKNNTLALIGSPGGTSPAQQRVILINNF